MCEYCGCQALEAIAALTAEHERIRDAADSALRAARDGRMAVARPLVEQLVELLRPHTTIEERGLFPAMADEFGPAMRTLEGEHRSLDAAFGALLAPRAQLSGNDQTGWADHLDRAVRDLFAHILREQDGVFPAALSLLAPHQWEQLDTVRSEITGAPAAAARPELSGAAPR